uniref:Uncharacterized protein n=1 Tax=Mycena chlorophos TaxID=658473 RepID=A0ABQ0KYB6_MYCCL|nr:predicted protein [Mycena chlorophos]
MKRGLPPLRPSVLFRRDHGAAPSTTVSAPRPVRTSKSSDLGTEPGRRIEVRTTDGRVLGNVDNSVPVGVTRDKSGHSDELRANIMNYGDYVDVAVGVDSDSGTCFLAAERDTRNPPSAISISCGNSALSATWVFDADTGELRAYAGGSASPSNILYQASGNTLLLADSVPPSIESPGVVVVRLYLRDN